MLRSKGICHGINKGNVSFMRCGLFTLTYHLQVYLDNVCNNLGIQVLAQVFHYCFEYMSHEYVSIFVFSLQYS